MPFVAILFGAAMIVVAFNNTQASFGLALETDLKGYFRWAAAIAALGALGYVEGLRTFSRWLLALVLLVIVVVNYDKLFKGLSGFAKQGSAETAAGAGTPAGGSTGSGVDSVASDFGLGDPSQIVNDAIQGVTFGLG